MYKYGVGAEISFEWDLVKEYNNLEKHGVAFSESVETFYDALGFSLRDTKHSILEARYYWVGKSDRDRVLTTRYTFRGEVIRIFGSAEWREFRELYYEKAEIK